MKTTYNKSEIFRKAWAIAKGNLVSFSKALKAAWNMAKDSFSYDPKKINFIKTEGKIVARFNYDKYFVSRIKTFSKAFAWDNENKEWACNNVEFYAERIKRHFAFDVEKGIAQFNY
jgi:hypothetical protein